MNNAIETALALFIVATLSGCGSRGAADDRPGGSPAAKGVPSGTYANSHTPNRDGSPESGPVPGTLDGIWSELGLSRRELRQAAGADSLGKIRATAMRIRDLVAALPPLSGQYVSTRQGPLTDAVRRVDEIASRIVQHGAAGDSSGVRDEEKNLEEVLDFVHGLYPPGVLHE